MQLNDLLKYPAETDWLEFKHNFDNPQEIGEYISALANAAAFRNRDFGYLIWGVEDKDRKVVSTKFNFLRNVNNEPLEHFLARQIRPSINFEFIEKMVDEHKIVILKIPAAIKVPVEFKQQRYIRIGSSKVLLAKYPEREAYLWFILKHGKVSMINMESSYQDLTFDKLLLYYQLKGLKLNLKTFENTLKLKTEGGKYNILAQVLADESKIPVRVSIFAGKSKADKLFSVKEFGNTCIFYALDKILEYIDVINIIQADERNRIVERKDVPYFDMEAAREAILNAFIHNRWTGGNAPQFTIYTDRLEIISHGGLPSDQTFDDFYGGVSKPVNEQLSTMFLQLRLSERSGRGVRKIVDSLGTSAYHFTDQTITVTIPFNRLNIYEKVDYKVDYKLSQIQSLIVGEIRNNPNVTIPQLQVKLNLSRAGVTKNLKLLTTNGIIRRIGADKNGFWEVINDE